MIWWAPGHIKHLAMSIEATERHLSLSPWMAQWYLGEPLIFIPAYHTHKFLFIFLFFFTFFNSLLACMSFSQLKSTLSGTLLWSGWHTVLREIGEHRPLVAHTQNQRIGQESAVSTWGQSVSSRRLIGSLPRWVSKLLIQRSTKAHWTLSTQQVEHEPTIGYSKHSHVT